MSNVQWVLLWRRTWCMGDRRRKWARLPVFKSWARVLTFHLMLILLEKKESNFSLSSRADWVLCRKHGNQFRRRKTEFKPAHGEEVYIQWLLHVLTNGIYFSHGTSNLHNDFKKQVLMNNCPVLFLCNLAQSVRAAKYTDCISAER